ncbi:thioesterase family protein [Adhaeribacter rhizoryzae]|uniref:Thioesterase n=1 Tax=Adhaeribacter rhizoryzae TaxID=2607907 RepID=A0A5M6DP50_9BACT|nr:thioesterase family protein [Adhaeribacter rhizoryzae]KAA5549264.1 thioesterase [Adhaeribacter rhizoryzae]
MARIKFALPEKFTFSTTLAIRITDINYGGHLGNDALLSLLHEARVQYLQHYGYAELDLAGKSLIMADVAIEYKGEGFRGDVLTIEVTAHDFTKYGFDIVYRVTNQEQLLIALAKTGMLCFDYESRKVVSLPTGVTARLAENQGNE